jgi:hypothetical protein
MDTLGSGDPGGGEMCENADECDDGEECTADSCADGTCEHVPVQDGTECYFEGVCVAGNCRALCDSAGAEGFCDNASVADGTPCAGGICQSGACALSGTILPCTEQGIRNAIAAGGGPYTFDCSGPTTVITEEGIGIDHHVILDGEGDLTIDGNGTADETIGVSEGVTVALSGLSVTKARDRGILNGGTLTLANITVSKNQGGGILNQESGNLTITDAAVSDNICAIDCDGGGIFNRGTLTLVSSAVSGNAARGGGGGILAAGPGATTTIVNSTISGNTAAAEGGAISANGGVVTLANCTISGNTSLESLGSLADADNLIVTNTIIDGDCSNTVITSNGHNIESPGNTCGFDQGTDQVDVSADDLKLGPLQDNDGPTMTHALGLLPTPSVAIDQIPAADCVDADGAVLTEDQRGEPRPETGGTTCDVGAFEVQP